MNTIIAVIGFVLVLLLTIVAIVAAVLFVLVASNFRSGSEGCDYCSSDSASRIGGGEVACRSCEKRRM